MSKTLGFIENRWAYDRVDCPDGKPGCAVCHYKLKPNIKLLEDLCKTYAFRAYEITDEHYGNSHYGPLKKLYVSHPVFDPKEFNLLGYGIIVREELE